MGVQMVFQHLSDDGNLVFVLLQVQLCSLQSAWGTWGTCTDVTEKSASGLKAGEASSLPQGWGGELNNCRESSEYCCFSKSCSYAASKG